MNMPQNEPTIRISNKFDSDRDLHNAYGGEDGYELLYNDVHYGDLRRIGTNKTEWGRVFRYRGNYGEYALYVYDDDPESIYLADFVVKDELRGIGMGDILLSHAEKEAKEMKGKTLSLKVLDSAWMHKWYARRGFSDLQVDSEDSDYIWMTKNI